MIRFFLLVFLLGSVAWSQVSATQKLSVLQGQIKGCGLDFSNLNKIANYNQLYAAIEKKYRLLSEKTVEREIVYRIRGENRKLKVIDDEISMYKFGDEDRVIPIQFDAKQKIKTIKGKVKQLILNSKVEDDWGRYFEQRDQGIQVEYRMHNSKISHIKVTLSNIKQALDCKMKNGSQVCFCVK